MKWPLIVAIALLIATLAGMTLLMTIGGLYLSAAEIVENTIATVACGGALISVTFVVWSYWRTNQAFVESQRPQLLIQVTTDSRPHPSSGALIPVTVVHYRNITVNQFKDLTISMKVFSENREFDLSHYFTPQMVMVGQDQRQRRFEPIAAMSTLGLDLNTVAPKGNEVILRMGYSYTYNRVKHTVRVQEYVWNPSLQVWEIK